MKNINCFIPFQDEAQVAQTVANLKAQDLVNEIFLLHVGDEAPAEALGCKVLKVPGLNSTAAVKTIAQHAKTPYTLISTKYTTLSIVLFALERMENLM
ncbi:MAG: glycosyltransferase family 2 protein, partial [Bacteroidales bacterium]|nr:glycosyltransferase family 2 protein [Bacteroidales bacterium]